MKLIKIMLTQREVLHGMKGAASFRRANTQNIFVYLLEYELIRVRAREIEEERAREIEWKRDSRQLCKRT